MEETEEQLQATRESLLQSLRENISVVDTFMETQFTDKPQCFCGDCEDFNPIQNALVLEAIRTHDKDSEFSNRLHIAWARWGTI